MYVREVERREGENVAAAVVRQIERREQKACAVPYYSKDSVNGTPPHTGGRSSWRRLTGAREGSCSG